MARVHRNVSHPRRVGLTDVDPSVAADHAGPVIPRRRMRRKNPRLLAGVACAVAVALASSACAAQDPPKATSAPPPCTGGTCWVDVSVATLWSAPMYPRATDVPSLTNPAHPRQWVQSMSVEQKSWLVGKLETQALYGTRVDVVGRAGASWSRVVVPSQPTPRDARGYPGYLPSRQLTATPPRRAKVRAMVRARTAWTWSRWNDKGVAGARGMELSFGTSLPVVRTGRSYVVVSTLGGGRVALRRRAVWLRGVGASYVPITRQLVVDAELFVGLPYLWAGTSGFGVDCSGFTYTLLRAEGITIPRDAEPQSVAGTPVTGRSLEPGDLVFFRTGPSGPVGHVGLYVGNDEMIDAPHTGASVRLEPVPPFPYYAGARRYLST